MFEEEEEEDEEEEDDDEKADDEANKKGEPVEEPMDSDEPALNSSSTPASATPNTLPLILLAILPPLLESVIP